MKVKIEHEHKCKCIAKAPSMGEGRDFWVGKLIEPVQEHPIETHCLHLKTQFKEVVFLCNEADFRQLQLLCEVAVETDRSWIETMKRLTIQNSISVETMTAGEYFDKHSVWSGTILVNPIWLMESYHQYKLNNIEEPERPEFPSDRS